MIIQVTGFFEMYPFQ